MPARSATIRPRSTALRRSSPTCNSDWGVPSIDPGQDPGQVGQPESSAQDPGVGESRSAVLGELGQPPLDQALDRGGDGGPAELGQGPGAVDQLQGLGLSIGPGQLLQEEGDSFGSGVEAVHGRLVGRGTEQALQQLAALALGQPLQTEHLGHPHPVQVGDQLGGPTGGRVGVGAEADEEE